MYNCMHIDTMSAAYNRNNCDGKHYKNSHFHKMEMTVFLSYRYFKLNLFCWYINQVISTICFLVACF